MDRWTGAAARQEDFSASLAPPPSAAVTPATPATGASAPSPAPLTNPAPAAVSPAGPSQVTGMTGSPKAARRGTTWMPDATGYETEFMS